MTMGAAILAVLLTALPALAQEPRASTGASAREEPELERRNEVAAIVAGTWESEEDDTFFTLGVEYERRLSARVGITVEAEHVFDLDRRIIAAPVVFRPTPGWKVFAGPGLESAKEEEEGDEEPGVERSDEGRDTRFLFRVGTGYVVELAERYSIGPTLSVDFVREGGAWTQAVVFGVTIGVAF